jgi:hypothetical protein
MSACKDCAAAEANPHHPIYRADCHGCKVRAMANSPLFFEAARSGRQFAAYRQALAASGITHEEVKAQAQKWKGVPA